ncbi:MAG: VWA domain-containing protein [Candidatus Verstraetearchaeota archaeon]|nr:VWA domain-containing protein [Candidatus Verstraetearchaeota archaeon]
MVERVERKYVLPFTAVVGQEKAKLALLVAAVNPAVGGVLLSGDKGTGKTTLVRALADLLPEIEVVADCPFSCNPRNPLEMCDACYERAANGELKVERRKMRVVDLPLSITVDRLVGTLDIKRALKEGVRALQPGLLAEANRNILYIDEVNLLEDYVADVLLDCAAMGWNIVEREGISVRHPARFILVGSMNPEEGELRPQILDRFGLFVKVEAPLDPKTRIEIVKKVEEFQSDPISFIEKYRPLQEDLKNRVVKAREMLNDVVVPDDLLELLAKTVVEMGIRTHRAEIVTVRAAKAIAALDGRKVVSFDDLKKAMELALPHRIKSRPFEEPPQPPSPPQGQERNPHDNKDKRQDGARDSGSNSSERRRGEKGSDLVPLALGDREEKFSAEEIELEREKGLRLRSESQQARGSRGVRTTVIDNPHGIPISYTIPKREPHDIDLTATIVSAILRGSPIVEEEDVRVRIRRARAKRLCAILLDSSGSMTAMRRIAIAKGIAMDFVKNAYVKRDELALICFKGLRSEVLVHPTRRYGDVLRILEEVKTGGRTPLSSALYDLLVMARTFKEKHKNAVVTGVLITDGKANVPLRGDVKEEIEGLCRALKRMGAKFKIYDTRPRGIIDPAPSYIDLIARFTDAEVHRI